MMTTDDALDMADAYTSLAPEDNTDTVMGALVALAEDIRRLRSLLCSECAERYRSGR